MKISDFTTEGSPRVGLKVKVQVPAAQRAQLKGVAVDPKGVLVGEFLRFSAKGRKVLLVLRVGRRLVEVRPQDAIETVAA